MNKYFSVKEIAEWCEVSKTTIQRTINELELVPKRDKNRYLYSEDAVQLICRKLNRKPIETETKTANDSEQNKTKQTAKNQCENETNSTQNENHETKRNESDLTKDEFIKFLQKEIEIKNKQIESQSEEIKMLILTNGNLTKQLEATNQPNQLVDAVEICDAEEVVMSSDEAELKETTKPKWWKFWA